MPIRRFLRKSQDKRKSPRRPGGGLVAHYWTGGAPAPHRISNLSSTGAFLEAPDDWPLGTVMSLILQLGSAPSPGPQEPPAGGSSPYVVHAEVVRSTPDGFGVRFLFENRDARAEFERFLRNAFAPAGHDNGAVLNATPAGD